MRWFKFFKSGERKPPATKAGKRRRPRAESPRPGTRARRERYSGWNDPDLPTYGDPFDG